MNWIIPLHGSTCTLQKTIKSIIHKITGPIFIQKLYVSSISSKFKLQNLNQWRICSSKDWGGEPDGNCYNQTTPIEDPTYWGSASKSMMQVLKEVFSKSKVPISLLNITQLSEYRKDAHTSIYKKQWSPLTPEQLANPKSYADCTHWCLPGLQDTWNELLYAKLFLPWQESVEFVYNFFVYGLWCGYIVI